MQAQHARGPQTRTPNPDLEMRASFTGTHVFPGTKIHYEIFRDPRKEKDDFGLSKSMKTTWSE